MYSSPFLAIDTETNGTKRHCEPFAISTCTDKGVTNYWRFKVNPKTRQVIYDRKKVKDFLDYVSEWDTWCFHNRNFDIRMLSKLPRFRRSLWESKRIEDTLPLSHVFDSAMPHGLKELGVLFFGLPLDDQSDLRADVVKWRRQAKKDGLLRGDKVEEDYWLPGHYGDDSKCREYAIQDAIRTVYALHFFYPRVKEQGLLHNYERELKLQPILFDMTESGLTMKPRQFRVVHRRSSTITKVEKQKLVRTAVKYGCPADFNPGSDKQLRELLIDYWNLPVLAETEKSGEPSMKAQYIKEYKEMLGDKNCSFEGLTKERRRDALGFVKSLREMKIAQKVMTTLNSYDKLKDDYYTLYPNFNQTGTGTTRMSSKEPNGQNISNGKEIVDTDGNLVEIEFSLRELFGPGENEVWYAFDYSQLQLRIFSYESEEQQLIDAFLAGEDFHNFVAKKIFDVDTPTKDQRRVAKNTNFSLIFGAGRKKVDATAGMTGAYDLFRSQFSSVDRFMDRTIKFVRRHGCVYTAAGYKLVVPKSQPYKGANYIVQGDEGDIVKNSMIEVNNFLRQQNMAATAVEERRRKCMKLDGVEMIMNVHDELLFRAPKDFPFPSQGIKDTMEEQGRKLGMVTPVEGSIIRSNWGKAEKLNLQEAIAV